MDFNTYSLLLLISSFVFVFVFVFEPFGTSKRKVNLPPGPRKLPFIGNLHLLAGSSPPHHILAKLATTHGPLMRLQLGQISTVVVSSPETAKQFLKTHDVIFASRPSLLAPEINCYGSTDIAFAPYGDYWRQLRKICTLHLLTAKRVQSFRPIREEETTNLCKSLALKEGSVINLTEYIATANLNIMVRAAFGKKSGEVSRLNSIIKEAQEFVTVFNIVDVYPSLRFLRLFSGMKRKIEKHHRELNRITEGMIEERRRAYAEKGNDEVEYDGDFLDVLLRLQGDGSLQIPITTDNIKSVLLDGAGVESSTTATDWAMAELLKNPKILKKAQDEVRKVFDEKNNIVNEQYFDELHYLKLVIKETLRLHPPGPLLLPRESRELCVINGYEIPAKTWVLINAWAIGRDPKYWEDVESFKPERFLGKPVDFKANTCEYIPFGAGRRICPAIGFGIANIEIQMAMLLYHFDWIMPQEDLDMKEASGLSGKRKYYLRVIPILRRPFLQ